MNSMKAASLSVSYEEKVVLDDLNVSLPKGKITVIIGSNGCGKSTILKALGRILKPSGGMVYLNGTDISKLKSKEIARQLAVLPQMPHAPGGLTVGELVSYGRFPHQKANGRLTAEDKDVISWALKVTGLDEFETTLVNHLSGGQRQRVWIAMALAQQTELILLDEPTTYLDLAYQLEVLKLLYQLNREQKRTIVMVLHDLNLAARFADHMIAVKNGKIVCQGSPDEIMTHEVLKKTFQIDAKIMREPDTNRPVCISYELLKGSY